LLLIFANSWKTSGYNCTIMALLTNDPSVDRLLASAGFLNALLIAGTAAAGATVLIKSFGQNDPTKPSTIKAFGVDIPIGKAWIVFAMFTVGHLYTAFVFRQDCLEVMRQSPAIQGDAWKALSGGSLLFFHGLVARLQSVVVDGQRLFIMDENDPTTWLVHGVAVLVFVAIVRIRRASWMTRIGTVFAGVLIVVSNWLIGGGWAVTASTLHGSITGQ
jgi:hypothetical protein